VKINNFFAELKRRNVYKVAVAYAVVGWLVIQVATSTFPVLEIPNWAAKLVIAVVLLGFPIALVVAWAFEMTPEGMKRTEDVSPNEKIPQWSARKFAAVIVTVAVIAAGLLCYQLIRSKAPARATSANEQEKSIAVLPFVDMSQAKDQEYFCDGISEELLDALAKVEGLRVVARTSSFAFKGKNADVSEIAQKLGVRHVLEGSLRRDGNRIRISAQLIDSRDGFHLWSDTYERELQGVFAVQDEITRAIVNALKLKLALAPAVHQQSDPEAHDLFLRGRYFLNGRQMPKAIDYFKQALAKNPNDALTYAALSEAYMSLLVPFAQVAPHEAMPKAKETALRALALDNTLGEAHAALAYVTFFYDWNWVAAEKEYKQAIELNPNDLDAHHYYSHFLMSQGRVEESLSESKRALGLSPFDVLMNLHLAWHYYYARQYDQAFDQIQKTMEMDKRFVGPWPGFILEQQGKYAEAIAAFEEQIQLVPAGNSTLMAGLAQAYALSGKSEAARKMIGELQELAKTKYVSSVDIAPIYAGLGEKDQAFACLEKAYEERSAELVNLRVEPRFDSLRSDPRFTELCYRIGLAEPKR
jgi:TolB-like protein/Tfp pilus assembly protein PilF